jgi:hypothetical protein
MVIAIADTMDAARAMNANLGRRKNVPQEQVRSIIRFHENF